MGWQTTQPTLLERVRDTADHLAWRRFDAAYGELVTRYGLSLGLSHADAEDARQIVMLKLARVMPRFEYDPGRGRFRSYLGTVVRSVVADLMNECRRGRLVLMEDGAVESLQMGSDAGSGWESEWEAEWRRHHMRKAFRAVRGVSDARSMEVFETLLTGKTASQASAMHGISEEAVHKIRQRVRARLRSAVRDQLEIEEGAERNTRIGAGS